MQFMSIKASIFYGDNLLRPDLCVETRKNRFDCKSGYNQWLNFNIKIKDIPMDSRIIFEIILHNDI